MIFLTINGQDMELDVPARNAVTLGLARLSESYCDKIRLWHRTMWCVHRTHEWASDEILSDTGK